MLFQAIRSGESVANCCALRIIYYNRDLSTYLHYYTIQSILNTPPSFSLDQLKKILEKVRS